MKNETGRGKIAFTYYIILKRIEINFRKTIETIMKYTISFPIWCIHDTPGNGAYHDLDAVVRESAERGFNCLRVDDGAGLIDFSSNPPNGVVPIQEPYPGFTRNIRQSWCVGNGGDCDLVARLLELFKAAKKYGVHIILSSWYYLHTYWYCGDNALNERLHAIPDHEKFQYFAEQLSHIIDLLRQHGYVEQIAFAEILNEADGLKFVGNYGNSNHVSREERRRFGKDHEEAIAWLRKRHPDVLFAYDTYAVGGTDIDLFPHNLQVWNCHCYYLWEIYSLFEGHLLWGGVDVEDPKENSQAMSYLLNPHRPLADIYASRNGRMFAEDGWYRRIWLYSQLDPAKVGELEAKIIRQFEKDYERYQHKIVDVLDGAVAFRDAHCPGVPLVMAEGCTFCASNFLQWEEKCDKYWELLQFAADQFKAHGFMGAAIRTCSGCEDPSWNVRKDDYIRIHRSMLDA